MLLCKGSISTSRVACCAADLPADALGLHVLQQHFHHSGFSPESSYVQGRLSCCVPQQHISPCLQQQAGTGCMPPFAGHKQGGGSPLVPGIDATA